MRRSSLVLPTLLLWSCGGTQAPATQPFPGPPDSGPTQAVASPAGFVITGRLVAAEGHAVPPRAVLRIVWEVTSGSPDYVVVTGAGTCSAGTCRISLRTPPPDEALNGGLLGVGFLVLLPFGTEAPDGRLDRDGWRDLRAQALGGAGRFGVIYRRPGSPAREWIGRFPEGHGCGAGAPPIEGRRFETFVPTRCDEVPITVDDFEHIPFVNWT